VRRRGGADITMRRTPPPRCLRFATFMGYSSVQITYDRYGIFDVARREHGLPVNPAVDSAPFRGTVEARVNRY
jgi:hypothetical protein